MYSNCSNCLLLARLNSKLHIYKDGIYTLDTKSITSKLYKACDKVDYSMAKCMINDIELELDSNIKESSASLVAFNPLTFTIL